MENDAALVACSQPKADIDSIGLENVVSKLAQQKGWDMASAEAACALYRRYLFLQQKHGGQYHLAPSPDMDAIWHLHILDTQKYHEDCQAIFGRYLHHRPFYQKVKLNQEFSAFNITQKLYYQEYKEDIYNVRFPWGIRHFVHFITALKKSLLSFA